MALIRRFEEINLFEILENFEESCEEFLFFDREFTNFDYSAGNCLWLKFPIANFKFQNLNSKVIKRFKPSN